MAVARKGKVSGNDSNYDVTRFAAKIEEIVQ